MYISNILLILLINCYLCYCYQDCPNVITPNSDRRTDKNKLRLMQYNVEWLFIDYYKNADCPGNGCVWNNKTIAEKHVNQVANIINKYSPDIINLSEVEGCNELNKLTQLLLPNDYNYYLLQGTDTSTGQNVGMITKVDPSIDLYRYNITYNYPVNNSNCNCDCSGSTSVSKHYITTLKIANYDVAFISLHLLAYPDKNDRCSKREAQASIVQEIVFKYINMNYEVIVVGDFNDYDPEILDLNNDIPMSQVLEIIRGKNNNLYYLNNLNTFITKNERYTNWWDKNNDCQSSGDEFVLIDHVLITDKLLEIVENVEIYHGYDEYCNTLNSDHYPIIVDFITKN